MMRWLNSLVFCVWCGLYAVALPPTPPPSTTADGPQPTKYALLIGIDKYRYSNPLKGFPNLEGAVNDVYRMKQTLLSFNFSANNIKLLSNSEASKSTILGEISSLALKASPEDIVVIHFSGHGSQVSDPDRINQLDETLVVYDSRNPHRVDDPTGGDLTGQELNGAISKIKAKHITVIVDSCHSGGIIGRGISTGLVRKIPPYNAPSQPNQTVLPLRSALSQFVLIAAAQPNQNAREYSPPENKAIKYGALTYFLTTEINSHLHQTITYQDVFPVVRENVKAAYPDQLPSLEGTNKDEAVFSDQSELTTPSIEVSPGPTGAITLNAGEAQGMTMGSVFDVFPTGTHSFADRSQRLTTATIISSPKAFTSAAKLADNVSVPVGSRAIETNHNYPNGKFKIFLDGAAQSADLQSIEHALATVSNIEPSRVPIGARIRIAETDNAVTLYAADSGKVLTTVNRGDSLTARCLAAIALWAKWFNVLSIVNLQPSVNVRVDIVGQAGPGQEMNLDSTNLIDQQKFRVRFKSLSDQDLYVSIVYLKWDGSVQTIYQSGALALPPGETFTTHEFQTSLPEGKDTVTEIFKIFATDQQIDLGFLNQHADGRGLKGPKPNDPLGRLLAQYGFGNARDITSVPSDWVTVQKVLTTNKSTQSSTGQ